MSELISGKDALIALANGEDVEAKLESNKWSNNTATYSAEEILAEETSETDDYSSMKLKFRLKPRTITINGIEVPAPFEPCAEDDCRAYFIDTRNVNGYEWQHSSHYNPNHIVWRTEEEIRQVVAALRKVFGGVR